MLESLVLEQVVVNVMVKLGYVIFPLKGWRDQYISVNLIGHLGMLLVYMPFQIDGTKERP